MLRSDLQICPRCGGAINRENHAVQRFPDRTDTYLYCDFCAVGFETSAYPDGDIFPLDFQERTEPTAFGKFLQRLEAARSV